jgi:hypothetical protein
MRSRAYVHEPALSILMAEPGLSMASKAIACYCLTRPPRVISYAELFQVNSDPMVLVRAACAELIHCGLVESVPGRRIGANGRSAREGGIRLRQPQPSQPS